MAINSISMKLPFEFKDLVENIRATRRSKQVGIDKNMLSQREVCSLITEFFKNDNESFLKLIKFEWNKKC